MSNHDRWATAVHESAHCVACVVLGGCCTKLAILPDGSGLAFNHELSAFDKALSVAAGPVAESLLADSVPPEVMPTIGVTDAFSDVPKNVAAGEQLESIAARFPDGSVPSDEKIIALYCIAGIEHKPPEKWLDRFYFIRHEAKKLVSHHRDRILTVAAALFSRGILSETEILELLQ